MSGTVMVIEDTRTVRIFEELVLSKLPGPAHRDYEAQRSRLLRRIQLIAQVPVVHHFRHRRAVPRRGLAPRDVPVSRTPLVIPAANAHPSPRIVLLGASTGGPPTLARILADVPAPHPLPIVVIQHIATGFGAGFVEWLGATTGHDTHLVHRPLELTNGRVYVAADSHHLQLSGMGRVCAAEPHPGEITPGIDVTFRGAATHYGAAVFAALLTGMGRDGSQGLGALRACGARTIVQAPSTCTVSSMPRAALTAGAATDSMTPDEIAACLSAL